MDGPTILRETIATASTWTYAAVAQAADGPGTRTINVAQISEIWGAGPEATITITL
jgi:hypothetical protein